MRLLGFSLMLFGLCCAGVGSVAWTPLFSRDMRLDWVGVVVFVTGGSLSYLAGRWLEDRAPREKPRSFDAAPGDTRFITAMLKGQRRRFLILGLALLAFDGVMLLALPSPEGVGNKPGYPWIGIVLGLATMLLVGAVAVLFLHRSTTLRNAAATRLHEVLVKTPHEVTGLTVHFIRKAHAPGALGRQILAEIHVGPEKLKIGVTEEQCVLLRRHIRHHNPQAAYREDEQEV